MALYMTAEGVDVITQSKPILLKLRQAPIEILDTSSLKIQVLQVFLGKILPGWQVWQGSRKGGTEIHTSPRVFLGHLHQPLTDDGLDLVSPWHCVTRIFGVEIIATWKKYIMLSNDTCYLINTPEIC